MRRVVVAVSVSALALSFASTKPAAANPALIAWPWLLAAGFGGLFVGSALASPGWGYGGPGYWGGPYYGGGPYSYAGYGYGGPPAYAYAPAYAAGPMYAGPRPFTRCHRRWTYWGAPVRVCVTPLY